MRIINRSIYSVKFEHPDHGYFHKLIVMSDEISMPFTADTVQELQDIFGIYSPIVDIEPILVGEDLHCL